MSLLLFVIAGWGQNPPRGKQILEYHNESEILVSTPTKFYWKSLKTFRAVVFTDRMTYMHTHYEEHDLFGRYKNTKS